jgi:hypothetical protein
MIHLSKLTLLIMLAAASQAFAQKKPSVVVPNSILPKGGGSTTMSTVSATPGTISFTATDPDLGAVSGSSAATISWTTSSGSPSQTWTLTVQAASSSFASCSTVPASAVTATCTSVVEGKSGNCGSAVTLSTVPQQVASGKEDNASNTPYTVTISFTLADSWSFIANPSCSLSLTYTVVAP